MGTRGTWMRGALVRIGAFLAVVLVATPLAVIAPPWGVVAYLVVVVAATWAVVSALVRVTAFRCPECGATFAIDVPTFLETPHMFDRKLLPCPRCRAPRWCVAGHRDERHARLDPAPAERPYRGALIQWRLVLLSCLASWLGGLVVLLVAGPPSLAVAALPVVALVTTVALGPVYRYAARHGLRSPVYAVVTALVVTSNLVLALLVLAPLAG